MNPYDFWRRLRWYKRHYHAITGTSGTRTYFDQNRENDEKLMFSELIKDHSGDVWESPGIAWSDF